MKGAHLTLEDCKAIQAGLEDGLSKAEIARQLGKSPSTISKEMLYSIAETAKANNLNIYEYLKYLLTEIPKHMDDHSQDFLEDMLPWSNELPEQCRKKKSRLR